MTLACFSLCITDILFLWSQHCVLGQYHQHSTEVLDNDASPLSFMRSQFPPAVVKRSEEVWHLESSLLSSFLSYFILSSSYLIGGVEIVPRTVWLLDKAAGKIVSHKKPIPPNISQSSLAMHYTLCTHIQYSMPRPIRSFHEITPGSFCVDSSLSLSL